MGGRGGDPRALRQAGFSLVELLVSMLLVALVLGGALTLFNYTNKLSRAQLHQSDLQQSARVAQRELLGTVRMAGRGGLAGFAVAGFTATSGPASVTPAITVRNNVPAAQQRLVIGDDSSPLVALDTDVLTVRGHFESPPAFVNSTDPSTFVVAGNGGTITISSRSPGGVPQDLSALVDAVDDDRPDALLITSSLSDLVYGVAELDPTTSDVSLFDPDPAAVFDIVIGYKNRGGTYTTEYGLLSADGVFPDPNVLPPTPPEWVPVRDLEGVGSVALLEEYRYYIRDPEGLEGEVAPRLAVGRFFPGTDAPHPNGGWRQDLASNVYDLQVALGFDSSFDGTNSFNGFFAFDPDNIGNDDLIVDGELVPSTSSDLDDWLFNDPADEENLGNLPWTPNPASGSTPPAFTASQPRPRLYYARVTTLSLTASADRGYQAPLITAIEDRAYPPAPSDPKAINGSEGRQYRRLQLTTIIDLRNL
ncbi:MAG: prepilin-type N-terminal cleavage/methylation domain-containing protein [Acidobacteriota bacterium]|nr:prepilin-type N-terminal cleavage/methylation domain-containing protein [Acidobacteriota bacterium]MDH3521954.1 prepilin-type N-terminal cleavage/methylation domain-containing protein [Acidobacteriota bacterium]